MQEKEVDMKGDGVAENSPIRGRVISLAFGFQKYTFANFNVPGAQCHQRPCDVMMGSPANGSAHLRGVGVGVEWEGPGRRGNAERVRVACHADGRQGWDENGNGPLRGMRCSILETSIEDAV